MVARRQHTFSRQRRWGQGLDTHLCRLARRICRLGIRVRRRETLGERVVGLRQLSAHRDSGRRSIRGRALRGLSDKGDG